MSTSRTVWGLKIYLAESKTQDTAIGLYTSGGSSWFRWIESDITGTADAWKSGIITPNGIEPIKEIGNFKRGGGFVNVSPIRITLCNTAKFYKSLDDASIGISGLRAEIVEFVQNVGTDFVDETVLAYFITNIKEWTVGNYEFTLEPPVYNRNAPMGIQIDSENYPDASVENIGKIIPLTFGDFSEKYAKATKTAKVERIYDIDLLENLLTDNVGVFFGSPIFEIEEPQNISTFPVIAAGASPSITYTIQIARSGSWNGTFNFVPTDLYLKVNEVGGGNEANVGKYRKITRMQNTVSNFEIQITIGEYFEGDLDAQADAHGAWVSIVKIVHKFAFDNMPCKAFLDAETKAELARDVHLFTYNSSKNAIVSSDENAKLYRVREDTPAFIRIPPYGYIIDTVDANKNKLVIIPSLFESSVDNIVAYLIKPLSDIRLFGDDDSEESRNLDVWDHLGYYRRGDGIYSFGIPTYWSFSNTAPIMANAIDKDKSTSAYLNYSFLTDGNVWAHAIRFFLPEFPDFIGDNFETYLVLKITSDLNGDAAMGVTNLNFRTRRFLGASYLFYEKAIDDNADTVVLENLPDFYFSEDGDNEEFYYSHDTATKISGYPILKIDEITDKATYQAIFDGILLFKRTSQTTASNVLDKIYIYEAAIMFKYGASISDTVYTHMKGRIFNDTWADDGGDRKTAANLIENPIDQYEHACRLQNFSEVGNTTIEAGKAYAPGALINTANAVGGFDYTGLDQLRDLRFSFQITNYEKSWTKPFKEEMLQSIFCAGYIDKSGKECITFLPKNASTTPTDTITLASVPLGMYPGPVQEPQPADFFCEPFVRYNWNESAQKFDGLIAIKQVNRSDGWNQAYTPGFEGGEGQAVWERCHNELWDRYHQIENIPSELTDCRFISTYNDAKWYLTTFIDWMLVRRIPVPVYYELAKTWHVGRHVYLQLPHQTNNVQCEAVVEGIVKNKNAGYCELSLAFWVEQPLSYFYKDTMTKQADGADADWKDTMDTANPQYKNQM